MTPEKLAVIPVVRTNEPQSWFVGEHLRARSGESS